MQKMEKMEKMENSMKRFGRKARSRRHAGGVGNDVREVVPQALAALRQPQTLVALTPEQWDRLLPLLRRLGMLGRFYPQLQALDLLDRLPAPVVPHLEAAAWIARQHVSRVRWEVNRIERVLGDVAGQRVLLKGAAYVMAGLRCANGRLTSDVDLLVPRRDLASVEQRLLSRNWVSMVDDGYDQQYYRRWSHELPPMRHMLRGTLIDVHHTIVPVSSRLAPDPELLLAAAVPLPDSGVKILAPADMVLHSAVHAFYDGDFRQVLRDLLDLHELISEFGQRADFWPALPARASQLGLQRPLYYALRFCQHYFATPVDPAAHEALARFAPPPPVRWAMDRLARGAVYAPSPTTPANWLLYMRSHWLRMPPLRLTRHLLYKGYRRLQAGAGS